MQSLFLKSVCAGFALLSAGCISTVDEGSVATPPDPQQDTAYWPVHEKWHRSGKWYGDLEEFVRVHAVFLSDEFRSAYLRRFESVRGERLDVFAGERLNAILVSLYASHEPFANLADAKQWSLFVGSTQVRPTEVRELGEKTLLQAFFPYADNWSREFLVVFDPTAPAENGTALPTSLTFSARSTQVSFSLTWTVGQ